MFSLAFLAFLALKFTKHCVFIGSFGFFGFLRFQVLWSALGQPASQPVRLDTGWLEHPDPRNTVFSLAFLAFWALIFTKHCVFICVFSFLGFFRISSALVGFGSGGVTMNRNRKKPKKPKKQMKTQCSVNLQAKKAKKANENTVFRESRSQTGKLVMCLPSSKPTSQAARLELLDSRNTVFSLAFLAFLACKFTEHYVFICFFIFF